MMDISGNIWRKVKSHDTPNIVTDNHFAQVMSASLDATPKCWSTSITHCTVEVKLQALKNSC